MSSIIAALVRTTPNRELESPLDASTVKVVPRLVEQRAAPAAKACRGVASKRLGRENESAIGTPIPVRATADERLRFALRDWKEVDKPPRTLVRKGWKRNRRDSKTFIDNQYEPQVSQLHNRVFNLR
jgi:hypothetical protein